MTNRANPLCRQILIGQHCQLRSGINANDQKHSTVADSPSEQTSTSIEIMKCAFTNNYRSALQLYDLAIQNNGLELLGYNYMLASYVLSKLDPFKIPHKLDTTKSAVWRIVTDMRLNQVGMDCSTYEWLFMFFGQGHKDRKSVLKLFSKLNASNIAPRPLTFATVIDGFAFVGIEQERFDQVFRLIPKRVLYGDEAIFQSVIQYYLYTMQEEKALRMLAYKDKAVFNRKSINLLLDACFVMDSTSPIYANELVEPLIEKRTQNNQLPMICWDDLIRHYGKYNSNEGEQYIAKVNQRLSQAKV